MPLIVPYLPLNPLLPRPKGAKDAEGMKKQIPSSNLDSIAPATMVAAISTEGEYLGHACMYTGLHGEDSAVKWVQVFDQFTSVNGGKFPYLRALRQNSTNSNGGPNLRTLKK